MNEKGVTEIDFDSIIDGLDLGDSGDVSRGSDEESERSDEVQDDGISTEEDLTINLQLDVYCAAARNELEEMKRLIGPEITDENRVWVENAMHVAASNNSIECGKFLITFHPNVLKVLDNQKLSPIDIARRHGNIDFINMCWQERMKLLDDRDVVVRQVI